MYYFSHHDKLCIVDNKYAALGGLDACFGRWDTHDHPLADVHPTKFGNSLKQARPANNDGQMLVQATEVNYDYNNSRVMDFQTVDKFTSNELAIQDTTRMRKLSNFFSANDSVARHVDHDGGPGSG